MNWTMASMDLKDDQTKTMNADVNELTVRGDNFFYKSIKQRTIAILSVTVFSLDFSNPHYMRYPLLFILHLFSDLCPTRVLLVVYMNTCPISLLQKSLGVAIRL